MTMDRVSFEEYQRVVDLVEDLEDEHRDCDLNEWECADGAIGHEHGFILRGIESIDRVREQGKVDPPKPYIDNENDDWWKANVELPRAWGITPEAREQLRVGKASDANFPWAYEEEGGTHGV